MTATDGGPAIHRPAAATPADTASGSARPARSRSPWLQTALALARIEAARLARSPLVLAGLIAGVAIAWYEIHAGQPLWWNTGWQIGYGQLILAMAVMTSAHLASGRVHRDEMHNLYASFPAAAGTRTLAHLAGLAGAALPSLALIGAAAIAAQLLGAIGTPSIAVLAAGLLLVIAAGAIGIAIGTRFPHQAVGSFVALALLFVPFSQSNRFSSAIIWLFPWTAPYQLGLLPGPLAGYPPASAHALELAGLAVLAGVIALAVTAQRARLRTGLAVAAIVALAVTCLAGALQLRPIPTASLNHLIAEAANPASTQHCTTSRNVQYCLYPSYGAQLPSLEAPVSAVLAHVPVLPARRLTIAQVSSLPLNDGFLSDGALTGGHPKRQLAAWNAQLQRPSAPANASPALTIDQYVGSWPAGAKLAAARFQLALGAADWAVGLPVSGHTCLPFNQAREAIAKWLAIQAIQPPPGQLQTDLQGQLHLVLVPRIGPLSPGGNGSLPSLTQLAAVSSEPGTLLAQAMTRLPPGKVSHVLQASWPMWVNSKTTDAQLAAALGIPLPDSQAIAEGPPSRPPLCGS